jgi:hypothetical protein
MNVKFFVSVLSVLNCTVYHVKRFKSNPKRERCPDLPNKVPNLTGFGHVNQIGILFEDSCEMKFGIPESNPDSRICIPV